MFFASAESFISTFGFREVIDEVTIDLRSARFWDVTAVSALDIAILKFRREGAQVNIEGLDRASVTLVDRLALHNKPEAQGGRANHYRGGRE